MGRSGPLFGADSGVWACGAAAAGAWWRFGGLVSGVRLAEASAFDGVPGAEEPVQAGGVADQPHGDGAGAADDHGGDEDDAGQEAARLHPDVVTAVLGAVHHHREPGLDVPREGGADHVRPVGYQVVQRYPQGADTGLELPDDVFLVAALVGQLDDLRRGQVGAGGDVEEVADLVEEHVLAAGAADVLTQCDDPVGAGTLAGDVEELRHVLVVQFQVEVAALVDDALLVVGAPGTGLAGAGLVWGGSVQPLPTLVVEGLGALAQRWVVVDAEDEVDPSGPPVEVGGQAEVGVPAQAHPRGVWGDQVDGLVDPVGGALVAGCVTGPVDQVQHLFGVGQRHDQRRVAPDAFVGHVHAGLALPAGGRDGAVGVDVGHGCEQVPAPAGPQPRAYRVDRLHQRRHVRLGEAAAEVPRRGGIRDQVRTQRVHVRGVVA